MAGNHLHELNPGGVYAKTAAELDAALALAKVQRHEPCRCAMMTQPLPEPTDEQRAAATAGLTGDYFIDMGIPDEDFVRGDVDA